MATTAAVDHDIGLLVEHIKRVGQQEADGTYTTTFGTLFTDDDIQNSLESLAGTLKAAKRKKIVQVDHTHSTTVSHSATRWVYVAVACHCVGSALRSLTSSVLPSLCVVGRGVLCACIQYKAELLLQGVSDKEVITLLPQAA